MTEHYVTLFDSAFLPQGLALLASLRRHARPFRLWVVAMDDATACFLLGLGATDLAVIPVGEIETARHQVIRPGRSRGEYCWTMTPATFSAVLEREPQASQVTYLDADLWFLRDPAPLLREFADSGRVVLITEHRYDPSRDLSGESGRFCVQFLTVRRAPAAMAVIGWWNERCLEWCFARHEPGRFGDQMYLDRWPELFGDAVHILQQPEAFTAPWNHRVRASLGTPVFHHFHGYRALGRGRAVWWQDWQLGSEAGDLYQAYHNEVDAFRRQLEAAGLTPTCFPDPWDGRRLGALRRAWHRCRGRLAYGHATRHTVGP